MSHWLLSVPFYLLLCFAKRRTIFPAPALKEGDIKQFALLRRDPALIAIRADGPYCFLMGLLYSATFFVAAPVYIWRYGWWRAVAITVLPLATIFLMPAVAEMLGIAGSARFFYGSIPLAAMLATGGYLVGKNDARVVMNRHVNGGWSLVSVVKAKSRRAALATLRTPETGARSNWFMRLVAQIRKRSQAPTR